MVICGCSFEMWYDVVNVVLKKIVSEAAEGVFYGLYWSYLTDFLACSLSCGYITVITLRSSPPLRIRTHIAQWPSTCSV